MRDDLLEGEDPSPVVIPAERGQATCQQILDLDYYTAHKKWMDEQVEELPVAMVTRPQVANKIMTLLHSTVPEMKSMALPLPSDSALKDLMLPAFMFGRKGHQKLHFSTDFCLPTLFMVLEGKLLISSSVFPEDLEGCNKSCQDYLEKLTAREWVSKVECNGFMSVLKPGKALCMPGGKTFHVQALEDMHCLRIYVTSPERARDSIAFLENWIGDANLTSSSMCSKMLLHLQKQLDIVPLPKA